MIASAGNVQCVDERRCPKVHGHLEQHFKKPYQFTITGKVKSPSKVDHIIGLTDGRHDGHDRV